MPQTAELTDKQKAHKAKRKQLRDLSQIAKQRIASDCEGMTVNEVLIQEFYRDEENTEFNTLWQWNAKGMKVKKGAISFVVWGKPKSHQEQPQTPQTEEDEDKFFPLCYLFSNAQVEPQKK